MEVDNSDIPMEDGEIENNDDEEDIERERHTSETIRNSFLALDEEKLKKRAERFGLDPNSVNVPSISKEQMRELYESFKLPAEEIKNILEPDMSGAVHTSQHRFEAIHLRGTEEMSTQNVFDYFKGYSPASIEWINDYSCNVAWLEPWQAAKAMMERSNEVINIESKKSTSDTEAMDHEDGPEPPIPAPQGVWRRGFDYPLAKALLMRFATKADRKVKGAERMSEYYRNYGNPNFGGMKGLISSSRKRRLRGRDDPFPQQNFDSKNPWGNLAEAWGDGEPDENWERGLVAEKRVADTGLPTALVRRLGHQPPRPSPSRSRDTESEISDNDSHSSNSDSGSESSNRSSNQEVEGGRSRKKRPRMRMYADEEEEKGRKRKLLDRLKTAEPDESRVKSRTSRPVHARLGGDPVTASDLRQRLGSSTSKTAVSSVLLRGTLITADSDDAGSSIPENTVDLRNKLQSRLGAK